LENFNSNFGSGNDDGFSNSNIGMNMVEERSGNILLGLIGGLVAAGVGGVIWALVTVYTGYTIGFMAIGVGFLVGAFIKLLGRGHQPLFGLMGATFAFLGCAFGDVLSIYGMYAHELHVPIFTAFSELSIGQAISFLTKSFGIMDIMFYGIAIYEGFKFSFTSN